MSRCTTAFLALLSFVAPLAAQTTGAARAPEWGREGGVCYEVFVRSFFDSDGDGIGDLPGLIQKLDYINDGDPATRDDLGARCIWLMPIMPSPSYHGYDVTNYYDVNRNYGTKADFRRLIDEAHRRGIRILVDLVLNHTSSEHPWFRYALLDSASPYHDWYRWSPRPLPSPGWQGETWHKVPGRDEYYYGLFSREMPDLNLADSAVTAETRKIARYWLEQMGADGFRLDAVGHLFEEPDGTWRNASGNFPWLRAFAADLRRMKPDVFTVGEAYDSLGGVLPYYPDQLDAMFMFEMADDIIDAVRSGSKQRLEAIVERIQQEIPAGRAATFLRNHDQTRTMSELGGDVARAKLAATLLLTLPGIPFVYYGEEIGMTGAKPAGDIRLRTPMQWAERPGVGFTTGMEWEPPPADSLSATVEAEGSDSTSLLNVYRRLIQLRSAQLALGDGDFVALATGSDATMAYLRRDPGRDSVVLVLANLGEAPLSNVTISSAAGVLPPGRYTARPLLGGGSAGSLRVGSDGRIRGWKPVRTLGAHAARVVKLSR